MVLEEVERLRAELRDVGERRKSLNRDIEKLALDTTRLIRKARRARTLTMTEVAVLVDLDRTYLYRGFPT